MFAILQVRLKNKMEPVMTNLEFQTLTADLDEEKYPYWISLFNLQYHKFSVQGKTKEEAEKKFKKALKFYVACGGYYTKTNRSWED